MIYMVTYDFFSVWWTTYKSLAIKQVLWKNNGGFSVMSHFSEFPPNSCLFFIDLAFIPKPIWWPHFSKVTFKQLLVCCTSWEFEVKIDDGLFFYKKAKLYHFQYNITNLKPMMMMTMMMMMMMMMTTMVMMVTAMMMMMIFLHVQSCEVMMKKTLSFI